MRKLVLVFFSAVLVSAPLAFAADEEQAALSSEVLAEMALLPNNTLAVSNSSNSAEIIGENGSGSPAVLGTSVNKLTIHRTAAGVDIYNGENKVEAINTGSEGWVGRITDFGYTIAFKPSGRPELNCPAQSLSGWYGPCEITVSGES